MALKVKLQTMLNALEDCDDGEYGYYINKDTGEEYVIWDEQVNEEYNDELYEEIINNSEHYIKLPDASSVDTIERMEEFVATQVTDDKLKKKLTKTIKKINRNRRFYLFSKEVNELEILKAWDDFCVDFNERYAGKWCDQHNMTLIK